ncbi:PiggyBac transposable element-derived protein 4 [Plakobranchus ocellatus]|uniref:PiggyBac transposable element-derived protein 4 n=1 Tax=Plakobranchus ocellatus TaxID=259542 RepID=A0AAV4DNR8_9GAST|nr:PiggyBac transposable element-derived protein 4 [Plakobranchus ocellatus]
MHSTKNIQIPDKNKTEVVCFYNGAKGGVDKMDQMAKQFSTKRKSRRWPLFYFCNMLDLSCLAANIIFKENKPNDLLSHQNARSDFIRDFAGGLAGGHLRRRSQISALSRELKFIMQATENRIFKMTPAQEQAEQARSAKCVNVRNKPAAHLRQPQLTPSQSLPHRNRRLQSHKKNKEPKVQLNGNNNKDVIIAPGRKTRKLLRHVPNATVLSVGNTET